MSDLSAVLHLIVFLSQDHPTLDDMMSYQGCSKATINRQLSVARDLGCEIAVIYRLSGSQYRLLNCGEVVSRALTWLELEQEQKEIHAELSRIGANKRGNLS